MSVVEYIGRRARSAAARWFSARLAPARWRVRPATWRDTALVARMVSEHLGPVGDSNGCRQSPRAALQAGAILSGHPDFLIVFRDGLPVGFCGMAVCVSADPAAASDGNPEVRMIALLADGLDEADAAEAAQRLVRSGVRLPILSCK